ncbi:acyltransferase family protein [Pseudolysobacter antarcticus]|uniref:acyltransferase family protein n=1 Tax=Pseudolysobacter antarcticus TaxID=2511995 RepID=UPI0013EDAC0A|nr:acyltransferase [Pseudolysobacter antarcticus]
MTAAAKLSELPALTGIRGFAALWVLLFHAWGLAGAPHLLADFGVFSFGVSYFFTMGWAGVDIFFTLSAFLLVLPFAAWQLGARTKPLLREYFWRRVLRIFPAYYAQLFVLIALAFFFQIGAMPQLGQFFAHLVLWLNMDWYWVPPMNGVWWTLPIECAFYLGLPLLVYALRPYRWPWLLCAALICAISYRAIAFQLVSMDARALVLEHLAARIDQFVIGMLAGYAFVAARLRGKISSASVLNALFLLALAGIVALRLWLRVGLSAYWNGEPIFWLWHSFASVFIAMGLYAAAHAATVSSALFANRLLRFLGEISFGVYLWHFLILSWLAPWFGIIESPDLRLLALLASAIPLTVVAAWLSYMLIERPFLRIARKQTRHPAQATGVPSA